MKIVSNNYITSLTAQYSGMPNRSHLTHKFMELNIDSLINTMHRRMDGQMNTWNDINTHQHWCHQWLSHLDTPACQNLCHSFQVIFSKCTEPWKCGELMDRRTDYNTQKCRRTEGKSSGCFSMPKYIPFLPSDLFPITKTTPLYSAKDFKMYPALLGTLPFWITGKLSLANAVQLMQLSGGYSDMYWRKDSRSKSNNANLVILLLLGWSCPIFYDSIFDI